MILPNQNTIILAFTLPLVSSLYLLNCKCLTKDTIPVASRLPTVKA